MQPSRNPLSQTLPPFPMATRVAVRVAKQKAARTVTATHDWPSAPTALTVWLGLQTTATCRAADGRRGAPRRHLSGVPENCAEPLQSAAFGPACVCAEPNRSVRGVSGLQPEVHGVGGCVASRAMGAAEIRTVSDVERLTPDQRQELVNERTSTELSDVPVDFVERARADGRRLLLERGVIDDG